MRAIRNSLIALVVLASMDCQAQVYSVHVYGGGRVYDYQWLIGSSSNSFGFTQHREYQDANGFVLLTSEQWRTVRMPTYTVIHLGSYGFRVRMPAWLVGVLALFAVVSVLALVVAAEGRIRRALNHHNHVT